MDDTSASFVVLLLVLPINKCFTVTCTQVVACLYHTKVKGCCMLANKRVEFKCPKSLGSRITGGHFEDTRFSLFYLLSELLCACIRLRSIEAPLYIAPYICVCVCVYWHPAIQILTCTHFIPFPNIISNIQKLQGK